jgi:hypothetical protein
MVLRDVPASAEIAQDSREVDAVERILKGRPSEVSVSRGEMFATTLRGRLGALLFESALFADGQFEEALVEQRESCHDLEEARLRLLVHDAPSLGAALVSVSGLEAFNLPREIVEPLSLTLVPERVAGSQVATSCTFEGEIWQVAVPGPSEVDRVPLARTTGCHDELMLAAAGDIVRSSESNDRTIRSVEESIEAFVAGSEKVVKMDGSDGESTTLGTSSTSSLGRRATVGRTCPSRRPKILCASG